MPNCGAQLCAGLQRLELVLSGRALARAGLEAITSRPLLLAAVGEAASHANQTTLYATSLHGRADVLMG